MARDPINRRFLVFTGLVLCGGAISAWFIYRYADAGATKPTFSAAELRRNLPQPAETVAPAVPLSRSVRVAIGSLGLPDDSQNQRLGDLIAVELTAAPGLELVERQQLDAALRETEMSLSGLVRAKDAIRVGKLLSADWFLLGTAVTSASGSNAIVARVVDAHTGVMFDAGVFPYAQGISDLAPRLGVFVRESRQRAAGARPRTYLAVGALQDVSVNDRLADFRAHLHGYLIAAYHGTGVTLLEREYVEELLREARLDLAGLTENTGGNPPPRLQSSFWLVSGTYQSYEKSGLEVEVKLNVLRAFGMSTNILLRAAAGERVYEKIKGAVDDSMTRNQMLLVPTRTSEARALLKDGEDLVGYHEPGFFPRAIYGQIGFGSQGQHSLEEAIRAFKTVLLLEPTNREAKMLIACCLQSRFFNQPDELRDYCRALIDEPVHDNWGSYAQYSLVWSFNSSPAAEKARYFAAAAQQTTNDSAADFYRTQAEKAARDPAISNGDGSKAQSLAEARLLESLQPPPKSRSYSSGLEMENFAKAFGTNQAAAARRLLELLPRMKALAPERYPLTITSVLAQQTETNASLVADFLDVLKAVTDHPDQDPHGRARFWDHIDTAYDWSWKNKDYALSVQIAEAKIHARKTDPASFVAGQDEDKMRLAFAYVAAERWPDALNIFGSFSNAPVFMGYSGPWGEAFKVVRTSRSANFCRKKMGMPEVHDPREFDMEDTGICFCSPTSFDLDPELFQQGPGTFAASPDGVWIGVGGRLLEVDFNSKTNLSIQLPLDSNTPISVVTAGLDKIWIGTSGAGVVEFDKTSRECRRFTAKDGLLMDSVSGLEPSGDTLWIGYGNAGEGGLGKLDLRTLRATSFTPSLVAPPVRGSQPPRGRIISLGPIIGDDVWMTCGSLFCYHSRADEFDSYQDFRHYRVMTGDPGRIVVAVGSKQAGCDGLGLGIKTLSLNDETWREFPACPFLPAHSVTCLAMDGKNVWVGGVGYLALVDPALDKVIKFSYLPTRSVEKVQASGGYVWAQYGRHLYRAPLNNGL